MRILGLILIIVGAVLICFNLIADLTEPALKKMDVTNRIAYYIGFNFLAIIGAIFILTGIRTRRRAKRKSKKNLIDTLLEGESK